MKRTALSLFLSCQCLAVTEAWLNTLARVESSNNPAAIGDSGLARGLHQFHRGTWEDTSRLRRARGLPVWSYESAIDADRSRAYARTWADSLESRLERRLDRPPTGAEVWCAWNLGFAGFARRGFDLSRCPTVTQRAARKFE